MGARCESAATRRVTVTGGHGGRTVTATAVATRRVTVTAVMAATVVRVTWRRVGHRAAHRAGSGSGCAGPVGQWGEIPAPLRARFPHRFGRDSRTASDVPRHVITPAVSTKQDACLC